MKKLDLVVIGTSDHDKDSIGVFGKGKGFFTLVPVQKKDQEDYPNTEYLLTKNVYENNTPDTLIVPLSKKDSDNLVKGGKMTGVDGLVLQKEYACINPKQKKNSEHQYVTEFPQMKFCRNCGDHHVNCKCYICVPIADAIVTKAVPSKEIHDKQSKITDSQRPDVFLVSKILLSNEDAKPKNRFNWEKKWNNLFGHQRAVVMKKLGVTNDKELKSYIERRFVQIPKIIQTAMNYIIVSNEDLK